MVAILPLADAAAGKMGYEPVTIFILAPGAFFVLALLAAIQNKFKLGAAKKGIDPSNRTNAAAPALPAEIPCVKEENIDERINADHCRLCSCK